MKIRNICTLLTLSFSVTLYSADTYDVKELLPMVLAMQIDDAQHEAIVDKVSKEVVVAMNAESAEGLLRQAEGSTILSQGVARAVAIMQAEGAVSSDYLQQHALQIEDRIKKQPFYSTAYKLDKQTKKKVQPYADKPWFEFLKKRKTVDGSAVESDSAGDIMRMGLYFYLMLPDKYRSEIVKQCFLKYQMVLERGRGGGISPRETMLSRINADYKSDGTLWARHGFLGTLEGIDAAATITPPFMISPIDHWNPSASRMVSFVTSTPVKSSDFKPRKMDFACNELREFNPMHIQICKESLKTLCLKKNWIESIRGGLANFVNLTSLDVSHNRLGQNLSQDTFKGLCSLQTLKMKDNLIEKLPDGVLAHLPELVHLNLSDNNLTSLALSSHGLKKLCRLYINNNPIKEIALTKGQLPDLQTLGVLSMSLNAESIDELRSILSSFNIVMTEEPERTWTEYIFGWHCVVM